ncbi:hypothetical protein FOMPIDRAFT_1055239 [Fomitopsis schrenkii]|uniref:Uncharacterized protein n=1 Tax=Fomitopsis schrenkii TaxID=2126942 RepID=S8DL96_FOMSC|nr:hypothetical protein FOMPIDRAFT_1055239 [Fomitopsis schrenkii]
MPALFPDDVLQLTAKLKVVLQNLNTSVSTHPYVGCAAWVLVAGDDPAPVRQWPNTHEVHEGLERGHGAELRDALVPAHDLANRVCILRVAIASRTPPLSVIPDKHGAINTELTRGYQWNEVIAQQSVQFPTREQGNKCKT